MSRFLQTLSKYSNVYRYQVKNRVTTHRKVKYLPDVKHIGRWSLSYKPNKGQTTVMSVSTIFVITCKNIKENLFNGFSPLRLVILFLCKWKYFLEVEKVSST